jgi:hypothetical protein
MRLVESILGEKSEKSNYSMRTTFTLYDLTYLASMTAIHINA